MICQGLGAPTKGYTPTTSMRLQPHFDQEKRVQPHDKDTRPVWARAGARTGRLDNDYCHGQAKEGRQGGDLIEPGGMRAAPSCRRACQRLELRCPGCRELTLSRDATGRRVERKTG